MGSIAIFDQLKAKGLKTDLSNFDQFREFTNKQKRVKGFSFSSSVGTTEVRIDLSGTARLMLGFLIIKGERFSDPIDPDCSFSMIVNNEVIIQDAGMNSVSISRLAQPEYFEYLRILSGTDSIKINFTDTAQFRYRIQFYYI